jgi:hypothetical protein
MAVCAGGKWRGIGEIKLKKRSWGVGILEKSRLRLKLEQKGNAE